MDTQRRRDAPLTLLRRGNAERTAMIEPSYADATVLPMAITASEAQDGGVTKLIRVTLSEDQWRQLRVKAAEQDVSMTRLLGAILAGEANKRGGSDG